MPSNMVNEKSLREEWEEAYINSESALPLQFLYHINDKFLDLDVRPRDFLTSPSAPSAHLYVDDSPSNSEFRFFISKFHFPPFHESVQRHKLQPHIQIFNSQFKMDGFETTKNMYASLRTID